MARKPKTNKVSKAIAKGNIKYDSDSVERQQWSELLPELLQRILSHLKFGDNVRASAVCTNWNSAACAVQVLHQSPWIMRSTKLSGLFEFYDPTKRKTHFVDLPELKDSITCYNKDGWLLLFRTKAQLLFFFNPFTREIINLPKKPMNLANSRFVAFSAAPTSGDCIVFTLNRTHPGTVTVTTCRPGENDWTSIPFQNMPYYVTSPWCKLVFCDGKFYCYNNNHRCCLGVYDPVKCKWDVSFVLPPTCPEIWSDYSWWRGMFLIDHDGQIILTYTSDEENPTLYKLDHGNKRWEEMKTLDGGTFFVSYLTSHSRVNVLGLRRNSIYFPKVRFYGKRCIFYSLDDRRYYPQKQCLRWEEYPFQSIWIEPPNDFMGFI